MSIYKPKDYEYVIARIQKKVIEKNIKLGECLSENQIEKNVGSSNCNLLNTNGVFVARRKNNEFI